MCSLNHYKAILASAGIRSWEIMDLKTGTHDLITVTRRGDKLIKTKRSIFNDTVPVEPEYLDELQQADVGSLECLHFNAYSRFAEKYEGYTVKINGHDNPILIPPNEQT